jgi:hypothetical protein
MAPTRLISLMDRCWRGGCCSIVGGASYWWYNKKQEELTAAPVAPTVAGSGLGQEPQPSPGTEVTELSARPISEYVAKKSQTVEDLKTERAALSADLAQERDPFMQQELRGQIKTLDNSIRRLHFATEKIDPNSWRASAWNARRSLSNTGSTIGARLEQLKAAGSGLWNRQAAAIIDKEEEAAENMAKKPHVTPEEAAALLEREKQLEAAANVEVTKREAAARLGLAPLGE